jgi:cyclic pyranopterin phosphate synthase
MQIFVRLYGKKTNNDSILRQKIELAIKRKPKGHDFDYSRKDVSGQMSRHMSHTGG